MPMRKKAVKKIALKNDKLKIEIKQIKTDLKKLKKSKKRMQLLWYRTKKEHAALITDLDLRLRALKKKPSNKKAVAIKKAKKAQRGKTQQRKK
jgi:Co/Zn/Cd efflux system component